MFTSAALLALLAGAAARPKGYPDTFLAGYEDGFDQGVALATKREVGGAQTDLFWPGMEGRTCFRVPALLTVNRTLFAFAESRHGLACQNDDCHPLEPIEAGDNRTAIVFRTSEDGGATWQPMVDSICPDGRGANGCADFEVAYDALRDRIVIQYTLQDPTFEDTPPFGNNTGRAPAHHVLQTESKDMGASWSKPLPMAKALEGITSGCAPHCDMIVGPGRGLQLRSHAHGKAGRLLFCGHRGDAVANRISPIWSSDDGYDYTLRAVLPRGSPPAMAAFGPDECQMAELANGTLIYHGRNNWVPDDRKPGAPLPWNRSQHRMVSKSTDGGDTWAAVTFDPVLSDHSHGCQGALLTKGAKPSDTVFFTQPLTPSRRTMTVHRSEDGGGSWPHVAVVARGGAGYSGMSPLPADESRMGLLYERDDERRCTAYDDPERPSVACKVVFTTFPVDFK